MVSMFQTVKEKISVVGVYSQAQFVPKKFLWQQRVYPVEQITFISEIRDAAVGKRQYSVISGGNSYRLIFDRSEELWELAELWCE